MRSTFTFIVREAVGSSRGTGLFALAVVLLVVLGGVSQLPQAGPPRAAATGALTPEMQAATWVDGTLNGAASWFEGNRQGAEQNQQLQAENRRLAAEVAELQAAERQNAELRSELGLRQQDHLLTTGAEVVARDPDGLNRTFTIDRGSSSGVRGGMAVVAGAGLVGVVRSVTVRSAQVETIAEPSLRIPVVTATTGLRGTAQGGPQVVVRLLTTGQTQPQPGEGVVTAGAGPVPPGLPVGRLTTVTVGGQSANVAAGVLTPFSDPAQVDMILVVRAVRG